MIKIILTAILCITTGTNFAQNKKNYKLENITEKEYLAVRNSNFDIKLEDITAINKKNSCIILPIKKGNPVILKDTLVAEESPDMILFDYLGELVPYNTYVTNVTYLLESELWLIDKYNGRITKLLRFLAPSIKYIVTYDIPEADKYKGIEVFRKHKCGFEMVAQFKNQKWFPEEIIWESENAFIIKAISCISNNKIHLRVRL